MTFADKVLAFNQSLTISTKLPKGVGVLNPFQQPEIFRLCKLFYKKYYNDNTTRTLILGINPGRHGAGLTGIPFTDPVKLEDECHIKNDLPKRTELSADFIYQMIRQYGGPEKFYQRYYISSVSPLGFIKAGKNLNYYDDKTLQQSLATFIINSLHTQLQFGIDRQVVYCLGEGKNFKYLSRLNAEQGFFKQLVPLPHPRFIMQYKRKNVPAFVTHYINFLR